MRRVFVLPLVCLFTAAAGPPTDYFAKREALDAAAEAGEHARVVELGMELVESYADDPSVWYALGRSAFALERHELAIDASRRAWEIGHRWMPAIALRIARSAAALERNDEAFSWLERALEAGLEDRQSLPQYDELAKYRDDPRFRELAALGGPETRAEGIVADVDFLVAEARRLHPEYPRRAADFEAAAEALKRRASELSDREYLFRVMELVARLGDGHSVLYGPGEDSPLEVPEGSLPVLFYLFEEGLYVVDGTDPGAELIGRRVSRIGRRTPEELLEHSRTLHGAENPMTMRWLGVHFYFPGIGFLLDAGAVDDPERVRLELSGADGDTEAVVLPVGDFQFPRKLRAPKVEGVTTPRYLQRVDTEHWFEPLDEARGIYFQLNQVRDAEDESISELATRLGRALRGPKIENLIIDLRHDNGGNNGLLRPLVREIVAFDTRPDSRVWVITGRNTFSAAQNFVSRLERWTDAVFVGEPSSSSSNFVGEETEIVLLWSRIRGSISSRYWQDSDPDDQRPWIAPWMPVPPRAADYFAGRDAALEAILGEIGGKGRKVER